MKLIFVYGMPGVGKLTVARELSALTGLALFHNHLAVDLALALFEFGTKPFVELRESTWLSTFTKAVEEKLPGMIFTFAFDRSVGPEFIPRTQQIVRNSGGEIIFLELKCSEAELERRLTDPSRNAFGKVSSLTFFRELRNDGAFDGPEIPVGGFSLDTTNRSAAEVAREIAEKLELAVLPQSASGNEPVQSAYDQWAATYDEDANRTRDLDALVTRDFLAKQTFNFVIELGCGTGKNTALLASCARQLVALDFSESMLDRARAKILTQGIDNVSFKVADITSGWPMADQVADLIVCNLVLEHVEDLSTVFREVSRCLIPSGQFLLSELHPIRQYQGFQANFSRSGRQFKIEAFKHDLSQFISAGEAVGLRLEEVQEWWHDDDKDRPPRLLSITLRKQA